MRNLHIKSRIPIETNENENKRKKRLNTFVNVNDR